jgi:hypothetical protein
MVPWTAAALPASKWTLLYDFYTWSWSISCLKGTHARDFIVRFSVFLASFNKRQGRGPDFQKFWQMKCKFLVHNRIFANTALSPKTHRFTPLIRQNRIILLLLWICFMLPKAHSLTPRFRQQRLVTPRFRRKREVWLPFFAENAQNDPKTHSYEDNAKFHSAFSPTALSYASRFQRNRGVIENFEYLCEFEDFRKCWFYCVLYLLVFERCKNKCKNRLWKSRACVPLTWY